LRLRIKIVLKCTKNYKNYIRTAIDKKEKCEYNFIVTKKARKIEKDI